MRLLKEDREIITSFLKKVFGMRAHSPTIRIIGFSELFRVCSEKERVLLKRFLTLNPRAYGFKGTRHAAATPPEDLVVIRKERIPKTKKYLTMGTHFLPRKVHEAYQKMNRAMFEDIGRRVFIFSGYRSPAYQLVVFLETLEENNFDMKRTARRVALPGWSEHGNPKRQAIDFTTFKLRGKASNNSAFERTKEYRWLKKHAWQFGFRLSYPRGDKLGVMFEPWHWHFTRVH